MLSITFFGTKAERLKLEGTSLREVLELQLEGEEKERFESSCKTLLSMKEEIDKVIK